MLYAAEVVTSPKEPRLSKKETALFLRINRHLTPEHQERYDALRAKREEETLTPAVSQGFPFAKAAVQIATLDLAAQIAGLPLHRFLGGKVRDTIDLSFALSIDEPQRMAEAARSFPAVKCFKVKVAGDARLDAERVLADLDPEAFGPVDAPRLWFWLAHGIPRPRFLHVVSWSVPTLATPPCGRPSARRGPGPLPGAPGGGHGPRSGAQPRCSEPALVPFGT